MKRTINNFLKVALIFSMTCWGTYIVLGANISNPGIQASSSGGGGTGANPSQSIDGSVHNGVATTFMRSDAAPALASGVTLTAPVLGTPTSGTLTNCTGLPVAGLTTGGTIPANSGANLTSLTPSNLGTAAVITTADALADVKWSPSATTQKALMLQGLASQTANVFEVQGSNGTVVFAVDIPSAVITGANNHISGAGTAASITNGISNTIYGAGSCTNAAFNPSNSVFIGKGVANAFTTGSDDIVIGNQSATVLATGTSNIFIGNGTQGESSGTSNTCVIGGVNGAISNVFFGKGITSTTATAYAINGTGGSGADNAAGGVTIAGGAGTGTAKGGNVLIQTTSSAASSSTLQTLRDRVIVVAQAKTLSSGVATTVATWTLSNGTSGGGRIVATIQCTDATDFQSFTQTIELSLVNKAGTYTSTISPSTGAKAVSAGTLTTSWTITAAGAVQVAATTSLTPSGTNGFVVYYTIENNSQSNVTLP